MTKTTITILAATGIFLSSILFSGCYTVGVLNTEAQIKIQFETKQKDNKNEYDAVWKEIEQVAQVTAAQKNALKDILVGYAEARTGAGNKGSLFNSVKEAVPNLNPEVYNKLINVITAKRDGFVMRQKELLDLEREHNTPFNQFPDSIVLSIFGRQKVSSILVTSTRTEASFETGKDDNIDLNIK